MGIGLFNHSIEEAVISLKGFRRGFRRNGFRNREKVSVKSNGTGIGRGLSLNGLMCKEIIRDNFQNADMTLGTVEGG